MTSEAAKKSRKVLELDKEQVDEIMDEERIGYDSAELTYQRAFSFRLDKYDFEDKLYKAVMRSLDPFLGPSQRVQLLQLTRKTPKNNA